MKLDTAPLFETLMLRSGVQLRNRIVMAPMTHRSSNKDGTISDAEIEYYVRRAHGVGMLITACCYVTPSGKGFSGQFASDNDQMIPGLRKLAAAIKNQGAVAVLQIFHGGRLCPPELVPHGDVVSASAVRSDRDESLAVPRALTDEEIIFIIKEFGETTRRAIESGFDGVEIHGANGYLIQQFFSPHSNQREDRWGGSLEKRMTFPLLLVDEIERVVAAHASKPFLVGYRFTAEEPETPGITMDDTLRLAAALAEKNLDYLHLSGQDFWAPPRRGVEDTRSRIEWIHQHVGSKLPIIGVGAIKTAEDAVKALQTGVPLVALGKQLIIEPDWVEKVKEGKEIATTLSKEDQKKLVIPDGLWDSIMKRSGWFPVV